MRWCETTSERAQKQICSASIRGMREAETIDEWAAGPDHL